MQEVSYTVRIEPANEGRYIAFFPTLPGCHTQGESVVEVLAMAEDVLALYLESLQVHGEPVPIEHRRAKRLGFDLRVSAPLMR